MPSEQPQPSASIASPLASAAPGVGRTGIICGLTGVFAFVLGTLILTRPEPLRATPGDPYFAAAAAEIDAALRPVTVDPTDRAAGLIVQHETPDLHGVPARAAHITVSLDAVAGPTVQITEALANLNAAPVVVAVIGDAGDTVEWRDTAVVRLLVERLCDLLKIDDRRVRWS